MNKYIRVAVVLIGVVFVFFVGRCFYMVACISCTTPAIRNYESEGNILQFETALENLTQERKNTSYRITDTVGNKNMGYAYFVDVTCTDGLHSFLYNLKYKEISPNKLTVSVVGAFDNTNNTGGYSVEADGMADILKVFNIEILKPLSEDEHIVLKAVDL